MIMHKNRKSRKSCRIKRFDSDSGRPERYNNKNAVGGGLEPIYENDLTDNDVVSESETCSYSDDDDDDAHEPLREYMSRTIMKHVDDGNSNSNSAATTPTAAESSEHRRKESRFQIVADNASTHPEFIVSKICPSKTRKTGLMMADNRWEGSNKSGKGKGKSTRESSRNPQRSKASRSSKSSSPPPPPSSEGRRRWENNFSNDSASSLNTASTSSLSVSICDDDYDDDDDDQSVEFFTGTAEVVLTHREIIERASDVVAGKYDDCNCNSGSFSDIRMGGGRGGGGGEQRRRTTMPSSLDLPPKIGAHPAPYRRSTSLTEPSPSRCDDDHHHRLSSDLDKYGVPIRRPETSTSAKKSRRRRERRSSMPTAGTEASDSGEDYSTRSATTTNRSVTFDLPPARDEAGDEPLAVDKYGIPIRAMDSSSSQRRHDDDDHRQQRRRSSMPITGSVPRADPVDTAGPLVHRVPFQPMRRRGRRSSMTSASSPTNHHCCTPPTNNSACEASEHRFLSEDLQIPHRNVDGVEKKKKKKKSKKASAATTTTNPESSSSSSSSSTPMMGAPIRPVRVPSMECFGGKAKKVACLTEEGNKRNACFDLTPKMSLAARSCGGGKKKTTTSTANTATGAPLRPTRVPSVGAFGKGGGAAAKTLDGIVASGRSSANARWGDPSSAADGNSSIVSQATSNSLQPQDGKWWL
eukprot:CAMPEP_0197197828 /NCGR_PEP_ID=MMETSP1423-20130617/33064_1 /TAXON_ID=476441 /ORGANISM="Pseudo-nitzschia heimii, Strain UNC1101" /LENGTH=693 /DNA_ID=CAMNT_0042651653 /DNA_START=237 /DNA_END=2318 /DNA_ORIENTATION=-